MNIWDTINVDLTIDEAYSILSALDPFKQENQVRSTDDFYWRLSALLKGTETDET